MTEAYLEEQEHFVLMSCNMLEPWGHGSYFNLTRSEAELAEPRP